MQLTTQQKAFVSHAGHSVVYGPIGSGKTYALLEKARQIVDGGVRPEQVFIGTLSWRPMLYMQKIAAEQFPELAQKLTFGTFRDFALTEIEHAEGRPVDIADNATVRRYLRQAMNDVGFAGTIREAEHIVRRFKGRPRKPDDSERHFDLFRAYKGLMDQSGFQDRYDVVRKHVIGMRNDVYQPAQAKVLLVDNLHDASQLQLLWLLEHMKAGVTLHAAVNDDVCAFSRDGALGAKVYEELEAFEGIKFFEVSENFRTPSSFAPALTSFCAQISGRHEKKEVFSGPKQGALAIRQLPDREQEATFVVQQVQALMKAQKKVAVVLRHDRQAQMVSRLFSHNDIPHTMLGQLIWEMSGAQKMLDLLHLLLGQARDEQLRNVLIAYGLNLTLVDALFANGLVAMGWLKKGAPLPDGIDMPNSTLQSFGTLQRKLLGYFNAMRDGVVRPRDAFKAAAHDMLEKMDDNERMDALIALEHLLSLKGKLHEILPQLSQDKPPQFDAAVTVAPARELRNMVFDHVIMPFCDKQVWPDKRSYPVMGVDKNYERHLFYIGLSRAANGIILTHGPEASPFLAELQVSGES